MTSEERHGQSVWAPRVTPLSQYSILETFQQAFSVWELMGRDIAMTGHSTSYLRVESIGKGDFGKEPSCVKAVSNWARWHMPAIPWFGRWGRRIESGKSAWATYPATPHLPANRGGKHSQAIHIGESSGNETTTSLEFSVSPVSLPSISLWPSRPVRQVLRDQGWPWEWCPWELTMEDNVQNYRN